MGTNISYVTNGIYCLPSCWINLVFEFVDFIKEPIL